MRRRHLQLLAPLIPPSLHLSLFPFAACFCYIDALCWIADAILRLHCHLVLQPHPHLHRHLVPAASYSNTWLLHSIPFIKSCSMAFRLLLSLGLLGFGSLRCGSLLLFAFHVYTLCVPQLSSWDCCWICLSLLALKGFEIVYCLASSPARWVYRLFADSASQLVRLSLIRQRARSTLY